MNQRPTNSFLRALDALIEGRAGAWFINLIVIPFMVLLILVLPPLALPSRVLSAGYTGIAGNRGGGVAVADGTQFSIPANASKASVNIKLSSMTRDAFMKSTLAKDLPITLDAKSAAYQPGLQGAMPALAVMSIVLPPEIDPLPTLDVYGYNGKTWIKIPFQLFLEEDRLEAYLTTFVPSTVIVAQTQPQAPAIGADVSAKNPLSSAAAPLVAEVSPLGLSIADNGGVAGSVPALPEVGAGSPYQVLPTISNLEAAQARADLVEPMLADKTIRKQHVQVLVDLTVDKLYPGLNIDYQGLAPGVKNDFTAFVRELAQALHAKDKILSVTVPLAAQKSQDAWETGAYDWDAIGQAADIVRIPLPPSRAAYAGEPSEVRSYLQWAVGRVDRYKLQLNVSLMSRDEFGSSFAPIAFSSASKLIGPVAVPATKTEPGDKVTLELPKLREGGGVKFDDASGFYTFTYKDDKGQAHTVALENAESLGRKIAFAQEFNLRGIALRDLSADTVEPRVWDALKQYRESQSVVFRGAPVITWNVDGKNVGKSPAGDPKFVWTAPNQPGDSKVEAALSLDDGKTSAGTTGSTNVTIARPPTPVPTPVPVVVARPTAAPAAAAPVAPSSNFTGINNFGYGIQTDWTNKPREDQLNKVRDLGFTWVKIQVRWCDISGGPNQADFSQIENYAALANARGIKVMTSIVCAPPWSRADRGAGGSGPPDNMQEAANFMGGLAGYFCPTGTARGKVHAIEVWNEQNLDHEWHGKPLSADLYMDMLRRSYTKIKETCKDIIVVSGAPTPTGAPPPIAIPDQDFMEQLYQRGLKNYSDAIGAHPSGYNVPALCNITQASCNRPGVSFNAPFTSRHPSWSFLSTLTGYRATMLRHGDGAKQIWATEFGWPTHTGGMCGGSPCHPAGADNNPDFAAEQYEQAYKWAKQNNWMGVMFAWQLDFDRGELDAFRILGKPAYTRLQGMGK